MLEILTAIWFVRQAKIVLFYVYLWQLKEYHLGRFLAHFQTAKGKELLLNKFLIIKLALFLVLAFSPGTFIYALLVLYLLESAWFFKNLLWGRIRLPVLTLKTIFLAASGLSLQIVFILLLNAFLKEIARTALVLLLLDIFSPLIVSMLILGLEPITISWRNKILKLAGQKRRQFKDLIVIGIAGSYGKTSVKEFLTAILSQRYRVLETKRHQNAEIAIARTILENLTAEHHVFIAEMGAYNPQGIKLLCDIAQPKIGILTGINEQHLATFGSQENIIKTKFELIESLPENGLAIFNGHNPYCRELYHKTKVSKKLVPPDVRAESIVVEKEIIAFTAFSKDGDSAEFKVNLLGAQNVENILLAAACAKELGMNLSEIAAACKNLTPECGGMKLIKTAGYPDIIDATYSANPNGVFSHLEHLKLWPGKKIIVMPCLIELGPKAREVHQRIGEEIGRVCDLALITTKDYFKEIERGALTSGLAKENILFAENPRKIAEKIKEFAGSGDVILLESRVPQSLIKRLLTE